MDYEYLARALTRDVLEQDQQLLDLTVGKLKKVVHEFERSDKFILPVDLSPRELKESSNAGTHFRLWKQVGGTACSIRNYLSPINEALLFQQDNVVGEGVENKYAGLAVSIISGDSERNSVFVPERQLEVIVVNSTGKNFFERRQRVQRNMLSALFNYANQIGC